MQVSWSKDRSKARLGETLSFFRPSDISMGKKIYPAFGFRFMS